MAEYLAPGVYVEELSSARSIEGVSTSTTGFVGSTRKGPWSRDPDHLETPELVTSFGDFERIYGGFGDVGGLTNYLAHAVRNYFDNGGSRLYVSRAFEPNSDADAGMAVSDPIVAGADENARAYFKARFPGSAGNGTITVVLGAALANIASLKGAREGSLLRTGANTPALAAILIGGTPPFSIPNGGKLLLTLGADTDLTFSGSSPEAFAGAALLDPVVIADKQLQLVVDGVPQTITLPSGSTPRAELLALLNDRLRGGHARLSTAADTAPAGDPNRLVIGSDTWGKAGSVVVKSAGAGAALGFAADATALGSANAANNVNDLGKVDAGDINALLAAANVPATASVSGGKLAIATNATGDTAKLAVREGADSIRAALGFSEKQSATGTTGSPVQYWLKSGQRWLDQAGTALDTSGWGASGAPAGGAEFLTMSVITEDADLHQKIFPELGFDARHPRYVGSVLAENPSRRVDALENLFGMHVGASVSAFQLRAALVPSGNTTQFTLSRGNDGPPPSANAYKTALKALEKIEDISIVAAPGHSAAATNFQAIQQELIIHVEPTHRAYRIAVLDPPPGQSLSEVRVVRSRIDSTHAALYYPWVVVSNPLARPNDETIPREIALPPSGFVCGIYARNDDLRGVYKAPANEIVRGALRFENDINFAQQEVLNPIGVNCLRYLTGRGNRLWGGRNASSDPEWKYVNVRRYFNYVERSIDVGTQWAVFEPNGERLWASIRETITTFLHAEWRSGALLGADPKQAFFVRCDRSTMTQNDLDNGRMICVIGIAVLKPAEFVIFRIGQLTADATP